MGLSIQIFLYNTENTFFIFQWTHKDHKENDVVWVLSSDTSAAYQNDVHNKKYSTAMQCKYIFKNMQNVHNFRHKFVFQESSAFCLKSSNLLNVSSTSVRQQIIKQYNKLNNHLLCSPIYSWIGLNKCRNFGSAKKNVR